MKKEKIAYAWKDRKRIFGPPSVLYTVYAVRGPVVSVQGLFECDGR